MPAQSGVYKMNHSWLGLSSITSHTAGNILRWRRVLLTTPPYARINNAV